MADKKISDLTSVAPALTDVLEHETSGGTSGQATRTAEKDLYQTSYDARYPQQSLTLTAGSGLTGGGDLSANRSFAVDINGLTADGSPNGATDYVMTYDADAAGLKKVLLDDIGGGGSGDFLADGSVPMTGEFETGVGTFLSNVANGAGNHGYTFNTSVTHTTSTGFLALFQNNGSNKAAINKDGSILTDTGIIAAMNGSVNARIGSTITTASVSLRLSNTSSASSPDCIVAERTGAGAFYIGDTGESVAFFGGTPTTRAAHIADPSGGATVDTQARTAIDAILAVLEGYNLTASA